MSTMDPKKPSGKAGQRSRKADRRSQKTDQQQKPDQRDANEEIGATFAATDASGVGAAASSNGALTPADALDVVASAEASTLGAVALADAPSIGAVAPADAPSIGAVTQADNFPVSIQTIANAYGDYTRKSLQDTRSFVEKLMGVRSVDKAIEIQTEFARQTYGTFVAESQKICELYGELAKQIFRPMEGFVFVAKVTQAGR